MMTAAMLFCRLMAWVYLSQVDMHTGSHARTCAECLHVRVVHPSAQWEEGQDGGLLYDGPGVNTEEYWPVVQCHGRRFPARDTRIHNVAHMPGVVLT